MKNAVSRTIVLFEWPDGSQRSYPESGSIRFVTNAQGDHESARLLALPDGFGDGEFTFEVRVWADDTVGTGDTSEQGSTAQRTLWSSNDEAPYSAAGWWFRGNFLLDGHNNDDFADGTFSLQIYGSGRVRWTFGDGAAAGARTGDLHAVQGANTASAPSILDGQPHTITCVRRWDEGTGAILELYIDGELVGTETTTARTDMASTYWDEWLGFPSGQEGWFFGAEKQAAIGVLSQYEDFKGLVGEIRFWSIARDPTDIAATASAPIDPESEGLVGLYRFDEGRGAVAADRLGNGGSITLNDGPLGQPLAWARSVF